MPLQKEAPLTRFGTKRMLLPTKEVVTPSICVPNQPLGVVNDSTLFLGVPSVRSAERVLHTNDRRLLIGLHHQSLHNAHDHVAHKLSNDPSMQSAFARHKERDQLTIDPLRTCPPELAMLGPLLLCPCRRNPDEVPDAHGNVKLQSVCELHSFLCQQRTSDTILDIQNVWLANAHSTHPSWGPTEPSWPSQLALVLHRKVQRSFHGTYCTARPGQFGWSAVAILTTMSPICSSAKSEEYVSEVMFFEVL